MGSGTPSCRNIHRVSVHPLIFFSTFEKSILTYFLQIRDEIEKFKAQGVELEAQRRLILADLEEKQEKASKDADDYNERQTGVMKILDQLRAGK